MAIDTKVMVEQYNFSEDSLPGSAEDVKAFFAAERARKDKIYTDAVLSERVDMSTAPARKKDEKANLKYSVIPAKTYAKGIEAVGKDNAFSFEQNIEARIADYEANGEDSELFGTWLSSVTGIACKACSTKFKIKPVCEQLKNISPEFNKPFIPIDYASFEGVELDSAGPSVKYNEALTRKEAKAHKGWLAVMNGNKAVWEKYVDMWFVKTGKEKGMGFYVMQNASEDQLRSVALYCGSTNSGAGGYYPLYADARFVSGARRV